MTPHPHTGSPDLTNPNPSPDAPPSDGPDAGARCDVDAGDGQAGDTALETPDDGHSMLTVVRDTDPGAVTLVLHGELDMSTLATAEHEVQHAQRDLARSTTGPDGGPHHSAQDGAQDGDVREGTGSDGLLIIDLSRLEYVDSSGVQLVLRAAQTAQASGHRFAVRLGTATARRVFEVLRLTEQLTVIDDDAPPTALPS